MRYFLLILLFNSTITHAQDAILSGNISASNQPLPFAQVAIPALNKGSVADEHGNFHIENLPEGIHSVVVQMVGFKSIEQEVHLKSGENFSLSIELYPDPLQLGEVVVTGSRSPIKMHNAPVIVSRIGTRTFESTQSLSLSEGLSFSPGLRMETNCQNCGFSQLRMNGLEGPYSQILINGRPVFSALAGVYGLDMFPTSMIDRVEVVRGAGSVMYGGNAIAGTVNIITKDPIENTFEMGLNQGFINGEIPDRTISASGSVVSDDFNKGISFYGFHRDRQPWDANGDGFSEITLMENTTFGFDTFWKPSDRSKLRLNAYSMNEFRRGGNNFHLEPHQSDLTEQLKHRILGGQLSYELESRNQKHRYAAYASVQSVQRDSYYGAGGRVLAPGDSLTETDLLALNAYGQSEDVSLVGGLLYTHIFSNKLLLTLGGEYQYNAVRDEMPGYGRLIDQQVGTLGSYAQLEWSPIQRLTVLLGGRFDHVNIEGNYDLLVESFPVDRQLNVAVPRFSVMAELHKNLKVRAGFAQGYRAPQAFDEDLHAETVGGAARFIRLDPNLEAERSNSFTASLNFSQTKGDVQVNLVAEGFYTELNNPYILSGQQELPSGVSIITRRNGDGASVQGVNLEANVAFTEKLIFQSGATLQTARYSTEEEIWAPDNDEDLRAPTTTRRMLRTPDVYGFYTLNWSPVKPFTISYSGVITGPMDVAHVIEPETEYTVIKRTAAFFEQNIKLAYTFKMDDRFRLQIFGGIQNFLNSYQDDFDTGIERDGNYIYGPSRPRTVFFGLKLGLE